MPERMSTRPAPRVVETLEAEDARLALAESCTGGLAASMVTDVPGASEVFDRGFVVYSNQAKVDELDVDPGLIEGVGAVAADVAAAMAEGGLEVSGADWAASATGIMGPTGGTDEKPVGTVYVGVAGPGGTSVERYGIDAEREEAKREAARQVLMDLLERVREDPHGPSVDTGE